MAEKPPNSGNGIDANELFNMAKAATKARREKGRITIPQKETPDPVTKASDPDDAQISEEENGNFTIFFYLFFQFCVIKISRIFPLFFCSFPENSVQEENADPKDNSLPRKLKRKSRVVTKRRFTKDDDLSNDEAK